MRVLRRGELFLWLVLCGVEWSIQSINSLSLKPDGSSATTSPLSAVNGTKLPITYSSESLMMGNQEVMQNFKDGRREDNCRVVNTSVSRLGLQEVEEVRSEALIFFIRPKPSFRKLVFKIKLQSRLDISDKFTDEAVDLHATDLKHCDSEPWTRVEVEYYEKSSRGPNSHALRVTVGETTLSLVTNYWWVLYRYTGFVIYAEGEAQLLFNCLPKNLKETLLHELSFDGVWLMASLFITATLLLLVLLGVWLSVRFHRRNQTAPQPSSSPVYEEFNEDVLENIRQKVEALRSAKSQCDLRQGSVVHYHPGNENPYVMEVRLQKESVQRTTFEEEVEVGRHLYQNVYSVRPTPTARNFGKTSSPEIEYQNLLPLVNSLQVDGYSTDKGSPETAVAERPYQDLYSLIKSQEEAVKENHTDSAEILKVEEGQSQKMSTSVTSQEKVAGRVSTAENKELLQRCISISLGIEGPTYYPSEDHEAHQRRRHDRGF
ncbi:uncharacterized protein LOC121859229 [Homarus americanus]|uniref:Uncharacterized protein n=1 Tax=Homarus americanus TaxID=6706 RepID=A0A8J5N7Q6_HOMAM|nr:uncharacterized protein LOC121859229 [Homarus americanus]KAG7174582.1 hypothetical protein Hamer_G025408 [Homarus americanus]